MIIGIAGLIGSGKSAVSNFLVEKGFVKLGHSLVIDEELKQIGKEITRENQVKYANEMRKKYGGSYLARKLKRMMDPSKNYVIEGFRNVAEVDEFRKSKDFILISVAVGFVKRSEWIFKRARAGDPKNVEEFRKEEKRDFFQYDKPEGQQNALCFSLADYFIANEGSIEDLKIEVEKILEKISGSL